MQCRNIEYWHPRGIIVVLSGPLLTYTMQVTKQRIAYVICLQLHLPLSEKQQTL